MAMSLSAEMQKWFDQNHTSRSTKPISGRLVGRGRFVLKNLLRQRRSGRLRRRHGRGSHGGVACARHAGFRFLLHALSELGLCLLLGAEVGDGARGGGARRQLGGEKSASRPIEVCEQGAARIRGYRLDRIM